MRVSLHILDTSAETDPCRIPQSTLGRAVSEGETRAFACEYLATTTVEAHKPVLERLFVNKYHVPLRCTGKERRLLHTAGKVCLWGNCFVCAYVCVCPFALLFLYVLVTVRVLVVMYVDEVFRVSQCCTMVIQYCWHAQTHMHTQAHIQTHTCIYKYTHLLYVRARVCVYSYFYSYSNNC